MLAVLRQTADRQTDGRICYSKDPNVTYSHVWVIKRSSIYTLCPEKHVHLFIFQTSDRLRYLRRKQTVTLLPYPRHTWKCHNFLTFSFFHTYRVPVCDTGELRKRLVATWADLQNRGGRCSWSVAKKLDPSRRWPLCTFAITLLAWHSICHTSQPVLFRATNANPQPVFIQSHWCLEECIISSVRRKSCAF